jgi:hypothetical protein
VFCLEEWNLNFGCQQIFYEADVGGEKVEIVFSTTHETRREKKVLAE